MSLGITYLSDPPPDRKALISLYDAVGWSVYTRDATTLEQAVRASTFVNGAYDDETLVGFVRCISDDATIAYLQDVLVHPDYQRRGIGRRLCVSVLERFAHCRQFVLLTDDRPEQTAFYESLGLIRLDKATTARLHGFARMPGLE